MKASSRTPVGNSILAALLASDYRDLLPKLERVALKRGEVVYRADQDIAARVGIRSIPTMILFRGGREAARVSGAMDARGIRAWLETQR